MTARALIASVMIVIPAAFTAVTSAGAELRVDANRRQIYVGESILLTVTIDGASDVQTPDLTAIRNANVTYLGTRSTSFMSVNWSRAAGPQTEQHNGREFTFEIKPSRTGRFVAGPIAVRADGELINHAGLEIQVTGVDAQDRVIVEITASRDAVLVDEPFEITLTVALKRLPAPYHNHDPLNPQAPPHIQAPFLELKPIDGLAGPDMQSFLQKQVVSRRDQPGFAINRYTARADPFDMLSNMGNVMRERPIPFMFPRRVVMRGGQGYFEYAIKLTYRPRKEGSYTFGPVEFKGESVVGVQSGGRVMMRSVFTIGPAVTVRVVPPPEEGRPPSFIGAIGSNLVASASLDTQTCRVGDPLLLFLRVSGDISFENMYPPPIANQTNLTSRFRVYDDIVQTADVEGGKLFTYTIRPTQAGTYELPALAVSYYDVTGRRYRTAYTEPIPLRANAAAQVGDSIIISTTTNRAGGHILLSADDHGPIAPMTRDPDGAERHELFTATHAFLAASGPTVFAIAGLGLGFRFVLRRQARGRRRRHAVRRALRRIARAGSAAPATRAGLLRAAMCTFISERLDASGAGLTPDDVRALLATRPTLPAAPVTRYCGILDQLFDAEFSTGRPAPADVADATAINAAVRELEAAIRATERRRMDARGARS